MKLTKKIIFQMKMALAMYTGLCGVGHSTEKIREFARDDPKVWLIENCSGNPPKFIDLKEKYQLQTNDNAPIYSLDSAHAEKTKDGYKIALFYANEREINLE